MFAVKQKAQVVFVTVPRREVQRGESALGRHVEIEAVAEDFSERKHMEHATRGAKVDSIPPQHILRFTEQFPHPPRANLMGDWIGLLPNYKYENTDVTSHHVTMLCYAMLLISRYKV